MAGISVSGALDVVSDVVTVSGSLEGTLDAKASEITNDSTVIGITVKDALNTLFTGNSAVFGKTTACLPDTVSTSNFIIKDPFGGSVSTSGTISRGLQEAINFSTSNGFPLEIYGLGKLNPIVLNDVLNIPIGNGVSISSKGLWLSSTSANGVLLFDTNFYSNFDMSDGGIFYGGNGIAVKIRPNTLNNNFRWNMGNSYKLGTMIATGGTPSSLLAIDVGAGVGTSPIFQASSQFVNNTIDMRFVDGGNFTQYPIHLFRPSNSSQVCSENTFIAQSIHNALISEILIGSFDNNSLDNGVSENIWRTNISHTNNNSGGYCLFTGGKSDKFFLHSANIYNAGPLFNFGFTANAQHNRIYCQQNFGGASGVKQDSGIDNQII